MRFHKRTALIIILLVALSTMACLIPGMKKPTPVKITTAEPVMEPELPTPAEVVQSIIADYLFVDNFEEGIKTDWHAIDGEWRMINGKLQAISGNPAIIEIGAQDWKDIVIEAKFGNIKNTTSPAMQFIENKPNIFYIGVRQNENASDGYWLGIANWIQRCTLEIDNEETISFFEREKSIDDEEHVVRMEIKNDLFKFYMDGVTLCTFTDASIDQGNVVIAMYPGDGPEAGYPWLEEIAIRDN